MAPEDRGDELEEGYYMEGPDLRPGGFAIEEEVEELEAYGMALDVEPLGTVLVSLQFNTRYLGIYWEGCMCSEYTFSPDLECQSHAFVHSLPSLQKGRRRLLD